MRRWLVGAAVVAALTGAARGNFFAERGLPLLQRFPPESYQGHYQINDLAFALDGRLYGASQRSIVRYDGARWERLEFPALWAWRLAASADGRIYVSGEEEIGWFADDPAGQPVYHSLVAEAPPEARPLGEVRGAKAAGNAVAFAAAKGWLVWQEGRMHFAPAGARTIVHAAGGALYAAGLGAGLRKWDGRAWQPFATAPAAQQATFTALVARADGTLLGLASPAQLLMLAADGARAEPWSTPAIATLLAARPLGLLALPDGGLAAFTRQSGLLLLSADGRALTRLQKAQGLPSDTTYGLALDREGGLWVGGTAGLARIDLATPASVFDERNAPGPGGMRSFVRQEGTFYAGVVEGVHRLAPADPASGAGARFERVAGTTGTINDLAAHPAGLLVAESGALHLYRPDAGFRPLLRRAEDLDVVWTSPADPRRIFLGSEKSVIVAQLGAAGFVIDHETEAARPAELITPIGADTIWIGTRARGLHRLRAAAGADGWRAPVLETFGEKEGLPRTRGYTAAFATPWGVGFHTDEGTWRLDEAARRFAREPAFQFSDGERFSYPGAGDGAGRWWASGGRLDRSMGRPLGWYELPAAGASGPAKWHAAPAALQPLAGAVGFLAFHCDDAAPGGPVLWAKSPQAVVRIETERLARLAAPAWQPRLRAVLADGKPQPLAADAPGAAARFPAGTERLAFRFSPGRFDAGSVTYRTRLLGLEAGWSAATAHPEVTYTRLEGGPFTLEVVAHDGAGRESEPLRHRFSVAPRWFRSGWARLGYLAAGAGAVAAFVRWRLGRAAREQRRLAALVAERTRELAAARDQAEAASHAKSAFLAAMSHELRTPLNGVIGYAQLLQGDPRLATDQRERVRIVHQSGEHLLRMINDVLDLAKIEAGKLELRPTAFAPGELLADVAAAHAPAAAAKGLAFHRDLPPNLPAWVEGDAQKLRQVLDNLLGNAVKFTTRGSITLRATVPPGGRLAFAVIDTGAGIAAEDRARLFQPFEQARATRPAAPGTGLGLAISRALVERMGGALAVESTVGVGSAFSFSLALPVLAAPALLGPAPAVTGYEGARRAVLVVDDHAINRRLLVDLLGPLGFACDEAESGEQALARLAAGAIAWPDLAIVDLRMARMDGLELTRRLRALPRGRELRVLLTSASVISFNPAEAGAAGCDAFLPKPFRAEDLTEKIGALLSLRWQTAPETRSIPSGRASAELPEPARRALREALAQGDLQALRAALARARAAHPECAAQWEALDAAAAQFQLSRLRQLLDSP